LKKVTLLFFIFILIGILSACSSQTTKINGNDSSNIKTATKSDNNADKTTKEEKKDLWTYYNGTTWTDDYNGFKTTIEKVTVTDKAPAEDGSDEKESAVGVKVKLDNTTNNKFTTYPDQAVLVTSTGEQIDNSSLIATDDLGGEIDEGVKREGDVIWYLQNKGTAKDIKWIKLKWDIHQGGEEDLEAPTKEYEVKLELKK